MVIVCNWAFYGLLATGSWAFYGNTVNVCFKRQVLREREREGGGILKQTLALGSSKMTTKTFKSMHVNVLNTPKETI